MSNLIYEGDAAYRSLHSWFELAGVKSVLLVSGERSYAAVSDRLDPVIEPLRVSRVSGFSANPKRSEVCVFLSEWDVADYDIILAVGGGTAMDIAKLLKAYGGDRGESLRSGRGSVSPLDIPIVAIPTTSGSGSEATHFAVIYDGNLKSSIAHPSLRPDLCVLDSASLSALPHGVFAASLLDALCQSIESYWSIHSTEESRAFAAEALETLMQLLPDASYSRKENELTQLMRASNLAGQAINITKTTAPHAVSYPITSRFGVMHGFAVASVMPEFLVYNAAAGDQDLLDPRGKEFVTGIMNQIFAWLGADDAKGARDQFVELVKALGGLSSLSGAGISSDDFDFLIEHGFNPDRVNNNPRRLTEAALRTILSDALER